MAAPGAGEPGEETAEKDYMRPVGSIAEALSVAKDLLQNAGQVGPALEQGAADQAFKVARGR